MKRLLVLFLALLMATSLSAQSAQALGATVLVDGKILFMEKGFVETETAVLAPVGVLAKALGGSLTWNSAEGTGVVEVSGKKIELAEGKATAAINGHPVPLTAPVQVMAGEVYLPAAFVQMQFGSRLRIDHPAMKEAKAMQMLAKALGQPAADRDSHTEVQVRLEEPGFFWVNFTVTADTQVRGSDLLTTTSMQGPLMLKESSAVAFKDGKVWTKVGDTWTDDPNRSDTGMAGDLNSMLPMMTEMQGLGAHLLLNMAVEARLGEKRVMEDRNLQDLHLVLDFSSLIDPLADTVRMPDGEPAPQHLSDHDMPQFIVEQSGLTVTVDLATGRAVSQRLDLVVAIVGDLPSIISEEKSVPMTLRLEAQITESSTPNSTPITWPAALTH